MDQEKTPTKKVKDSAFGSFFVPPGPEFNQNLPPLKPGEICVPAEHSPGWYVGFRCIRCGDVD